MSKASASSDPVGFVECVTRQSARGWAWTPSMPNAALEVEVVLRGAVIGKAKADRARPDLLERNYGNGRHGFHIIFDKSLTGDEVPILMANYAG